MMWWWWSVICVISLIFMVLRCWFVRCLCVRLLMNWVCWMMWFFVFFVMFVLFLIRSVSCNMLLMILVSVWLRSRIRVFLRWLKIWFFFIFGGIWLIFFCWSLLGFCWGSFLIMLYWVLIGGFVLIIFGFRGWWFFFSWIIVMKLMVICFLILFFIVLIWRSFLCRRLLVGCYDSMWGLMK